MRSGQVMDCRYLGDVGRWKLPRWAAVGLLRCTGYVIWATQETGGGNCGHESTKFVDSSTVRTKKLCQELYNLHLHPKPSMTTSPFLHPGGPVPGSTIYGNVFTKASWDRRVSFGEASPIRIPPVGKCLEFRHRYWYRHILDYTSMHNWSTG